jgi:hypothetical protein
MVHGWSIQGPRGLIASLDFHGCLAYGTGRAGPEGWRSAAQGSQKSGVPLSEGHSQ